MFTCHRLEPTYKLDCPHAMGTNAFSPQRAESFRYFLLLSTPSLAYYRREPTNLRVSVGARAPQLQTSSLRVCNYAGARSSFAQRTTTGHAGRCSEIVEARSSAAPACTSELPTQARLWLEWGTAFLAKAVLRFQHPRLPAVCGEAALHSSQSGEGWVVRASGGLGVEQFPPLRKREGGTGRDRIRVDSPKTRASGGRTLRSGRTAPLKPKAGLNGPPFE